MRVLFFGMDGLFSVAPFRTLLGLRSAGIEIVAVIIPALRGSEGDKDHLRLLRRPNPVRSEIPLESNLASENIIRLAFEANIPVLEVIGRLADIDPATPGLPSTLSELHPDLILVACFNQIIPRRLLDLPGFGALNIHPSLLPEYRGPEPLFWIFHDGLEHAGVTIHLMNERADEGDIVAQTPVKVPDGATYAEAEHLCSEKGADLLTGVLDSLQNNRFGHVAQNHARATRAPIPTQADYIVGRDWQTRRAFNFIRGLRELDAPTCIQSASGAVRVRDVLLEDPNDMRRLSIGKNKEILTTRFADGELSFLPG